jgi:hypothetical protein
MALDPEELVTLTNHGTMRLRSAVARAMMLLPKERDVATIVREGEGRQAVQRRRLSGLKGRSHLPGVLVGCVLQYGKPSRFIHPRPHRKGHGRSCRRSGVLGQPS